MKTSAGFTLIELMIVLAVIVILTTVVTPNFGPFVQQSRMDSIQGRLLTSVSMARSEAIRRDVQVTVCARNTTENMANYSCGSSWANGWVVVAGTEAVRVEEPPAAVITLTGSDEDGSITSIAFESSGLLSGGSDVCFSADDGDSDTDVRYLQVNQFGRIRAWDGGSDDSVCGSG